MSAHREPHERTMRCGVFKTVEEAHAVVEHLRTSGFDREQISVLCSDESKERHFREYEHQDPAGSHTAEAAAVGSMSGGLLGGLVTIGLTTTAGIAIVALGPSFLIGGAVAGGLIGAMQTRGIEGELADFYDQALTRGDLLVAVTDKEPGHADRLDRAEQVFREHGVKPIPIDADR